MGLYINTNVASMNAQRSLGTTQARLEGNLGRLSSGQRINTAADDSAGLAISERFKSQIRGLGQAERNANDGVSMLQTAEGALNEISGVLTRIRELAVQSSNGTLGSQERVYIENENAALQAEITRISDVTEFNGQKLLDGSLSSGTANATLQVGTSASSINQISFNIQNSDFSTLAGLLSLGIATPTQVSDIDAAVAALTAMLEEELGGAGAVARIDETQMARNWADFQATTWGSMTPAELLAVFSKTFNGAGNDAAALAARIAAWKTAAAQLKDHGASTAVGAY